MKLVLSFLSFCLVARSLCFNNSSPCNGISFHRLGCFSLDPPFDNTQWLPQAPSEVGTLFRLYTRRNRDVPQLLVPHDRSSIIQSHLNGRRPTKIIIHGFLQTGTMEYVLNMKTALLDKGPMNVLVVDWENGAAFPYNQAVANTRLVAAQLYVLLDDMVRARQVDVSKVHIIGHSLGAHVAGYVGARTPGLGRISGLDPAQPSYHNFSTDVRLDSSDASFVDVIHTDAIPFDTLGGFGMIEPVGHIDFYPNAGRHQPGCHDESSYMGLVEDFIGQGLTATESRISCSHERSTQLFLASIIHSASSDHHQCFFRAVHCDTFEKFMRGECLNCLPNLCPIMGIEAPSSQARGVHYLNTTSSPGYCGFQYFVTVSVSDSSMSFTYGHIEVMVTGNLASTSWTQVHLGEILPGTTMTTMILCPYDIGNPVEVSVRAHYIYSLFSWTSYQVTLNKVKVDSIMEFNTHFFCDEGMVLLDGEYITVSSPVYEESSCIWA
ncbi:hypothetical protein EGW08_009811 [Elysia chlorotica]|uniref:Lipase domain-containing protein n=1 Tax=Elysia chlorotica TaxID=188477 RepID=A0A3S0ZTI1_ELYCH|nr:hypothetical protein EGW08_009811 [Elysia chlorotica]